MVDEKEWKSDVYPTKGLAMKARNINLGCLLFGFGLGGMAGFILKSLIDGRGRG